MPLWNGKDDANDPNTCQGITLLSQPLKVLERVLKAKLMCKMEDNIGN